MCAAGLGQPPSACLSPLAPPTRKAREEVGHSSNAMCTLTHDASHSQPHLLLLIHPLGHLGLSQLPLLLLLLLRVCLARLQWGQACCAISLWWRSLPALSILSSGHEPCGVRLCREQAVLVLRFAGPLSASLGGMRWRLPTHMRTPPTRMPRTPGLLTRTHMGRPPACPPWQSRPRQSPTYHTKAHLT